jgi:hypothetical protein
MSSLCASFQSQGIKVIPDGVTEARTQWFVVFFWTPHRQVKTGVIAMELLLPSPVRIEISASAGARRDRIVRSFVAVDFLIR